MSYPTRLGWIRASDVSEFSFCHRAWSLSRQQVPVTAEQQVKREEGTGYHEQHGAVVNGGLSLQRWAIGLLLLAALLLLFAITVGK